MTCASLAAEAGVTSPDDRLGPAGDLTFGEDVGYVVAYCLLRQFEPARDFGIRQVLSNQRKDLAFPVGQLRKRIRWGCLIRLK